MDDQFITTTQGHKVHADPDNRDAVAYREATRDPIFLLQRRVFTGLNPEYLLLGHNCDHDGEDLWVSVEMFGEEEIETAKKDGYFRAAGEDADYDAVSLTDFEIMERGWGDYYWDTRSVWGRREEAEAYARSQKHNLGTLGKSCRVYCVCAEGRLAKVLQAVPNAETESYVQTQDFKMAISAYKKAMNKMIGAAQ